MNGVNRRLDMKAPKSKRDTMTEDSKGPGIDGNRIAEGRSSPNGNDEDLEIKVRNAELPPRLKQLISAAVRAWEIRRGIRSIYPTPGVRLRPHRGHG